MIRTAVASSWLWLIFQTYTDNQVKIKLQHRSALLLFAALKSANFNLLVTSSPESGLCLVLFSKCWFQPVHYFTRTQMMWLTCGAGLDFPVVTLLSLKYITTSSGVWPLPEKSAAKYRRYLFVVLSSECPVTRYPRDISLAFHWSL